jgi:hypothetical protein
MTTKYEYPEGEENVHGAYRGTWLALSFALIYQEAG